jgi:hypothetical protein
MNAVVQEPVRIDLPRAEVLQLAAADDVWYCRQFFPRTFRQRTPEWHRDFWYHFNNSERDFFGAEIFRGGAKTTLTRAGLSKRIGFGLTRNTLAIAINETMASHTVRWIKKQVEDQTYWAQIFQIQKGSKWTDDWIELINVPLDMKINVIAKGMTSGIRGLNFDDWRPDFVVCDDISNEETTGTPEQLEKQKNIFFGTIIPAMAPKSEAPNRKLVLLQTGLHKEDIINQAHNDPTFFTVKYPKLVFDAATGAPLSAWPERYPIEEILKERNEYIRKKLYHVWLREYGCKIISKETAAFDAEWLRDWNSLPVTLEYYIGLDPASDSKKKQAHKAAGAVIGMSRRTGDVYLIEYLAQSGKNPEELWTWLKRCYIQYRPRKIGVETVGFQRILKWYFEQKMREENFYFSITSFDDRRAKPDRIRQAYTGLASQGKLHINPNHIEFRAGFTDFQDNVDWDLGDAGAIAICMANPWMIIPTEGPDPEENPDAWIIEEEKSIPDLEFESGAP